MTSLPKLIPQQIDFKPEKNKHDMECANNIMHKYSFKKKKNEQL